MVMHSHIHICDRYINSCDSRAALCFIKLDLIRLWLSDESTRCNFVFIFITTIVMYMKSASNRVIEL